MADRYSTFAALAAGEKRKADYDIRIAKRGTPLAAIAPHGGHIEPGTSQIAAAIAGEDHSYYAFEGLRPDRRHGDLHIKSALFDEPEALDLMDQTRTAVAIHGRADEGDPSTVWVGGLDASLRDGIVAVLQSAGFDAIVAKGSLAGRDPANICNRGTGKAGVQLELPRTLRNQLSAEPEQLRVFSDAIRGVIGDAKSDARGK